MSARYVVPSARRVAAMMTLFQFIDRLLLAVSSRPGARIANDRC